MFLIRRKQRVTNPIQIFKRRFTSDKRIIYVYWKLKLFNLGIFLSKRQERRTQTPNNCRGQAKPSKNMAIRNWIENPSNSII